jgi:hypothetical protein
MANKKLPELAHEGLGDITDLLHNQGVSDLSWLAVDEKEYREHEALPKQNLDTIPELQSALRQEGDERIPSLILLRPHTIVNQNPLDRPSNTLRAASGLVRNRTAHYLMAGLSTKAIAEKLQLEFGPEDLRAASNEVRPLLEEHGLIGNVYVDANHFPRCAQDGADRKFVASKAKRALFVLAKDECTNCVHNKSGMCSSFNKRIVEEVPYNQKTLAHYAVQLSTEQRFDGSRISSTMTSADCKSILRDGFLQTPIASRGESVKTIQHHPKPAQIKLTPEDIRSFWDRRLATSGAEEMPGPLYLKAARQLMMGVADLNTISASSNPEVRKLAREYGILGHTYVDMDAMGGCRPTLDLIASRDLAPDFILRRASNCSMCHGHADGACAELQQTVAPIVNARPELSKDHLASALIRAEYQGRVSASQHASVLEKVGDTANWITLVAQANLIQPGQDSAPKAYEGPNLSFFQGTPGRELAVETVDPETVRKAISHMMNTGLSGKKLQAAVLARYSRSELAQVPEVGHRLSADDGIQGEYFIDPTAYPDYGRGCSAGAQQFRKRGAPYVLAAVGCTGCRLQTAPGWCSKYAKSLIRQVPTEVRSAAKERKALRMLVEPPLAVENPVEKYELASSELEIDMKGSKSRPIEVSIPTPNVTE